MTLAQRQYFSNSKISKPCWNRLLWTNAFQNSKKQKQISFYRQPCMYRCEIQKTTCPKLLLETSMVHRVAFCIISCIKSFVMVSSSEQPAMSKCRMGKLSNAEKMTAAPSLPIGFKRKMSFSSARLSRTLLRTKAPSEPVRKYTRLLFWKFYLTFLYNSGAIILFCV